MPFGRVADDARRACCRRCAGSSRRWRPSASAQSAGWNSSPCRDGRHATRPGRPAVGRTWRAGCGCGAACRAVVPGDVQRVARERHGRELDRPHELAGPRLSGAELGRRRDVGDLHGRGRSVCPAVGRREQRLVELTGCRRRSRGRRRRSARRRRTASPFAGSTSRLRPDVLLRTSSRVCRRSRRCLSA